MINGVLRYSESLDTNSNQGCLWILSLISEYACFLKKVKYDRFLLFFFDRHTNIRIARSRISHASNVVRILMRRHVIHSTWCGVLYFMSPKLHWFPLLARSKAHHRPRILCAPIYYFSPLVIYRPHSGNGTCEACLTHV